MTITDITEDLISIVAKEIYASNLLVLDGSYKPIQTVIPTVKTISPPKSSKPFNPKPRNKVGAYEDWMSFLQNEFSAVQLYKKKNAVKEFFRLRGYVIKIQNTTWASHVKLKDNSVKPAIIIKHKPTGGNYLNPFFKMENSHGQ